MRKVTILILLTYIVVQPIYLYATEITGQMLEHRTTIYRT